MGSGPKMSIAHNSIGCPTSIQGLSRKFHQQRAGPYKVLSRLGNTNYHIEPVSGNGKTKVVHRNRLKPATCRPRGVGDVFVDGLEEKPSPITVEYETRIYHEDKIKDVQPLPPEDLPPFGDPPASVGHQTDTRTTTWRK